MTKIFHQNVFKKNKETVPVDVKIKVLEVDPSSHIQFFY